MKSFPLLMGLQTMRDLDLSAAFKTGIVRDPEGKPYRLYNQASLPKLRESLRILSAAWSRKGAETYIVQRPGSGKALQDGVKGRSKEVQTARSQIRDEPVKHILHKRSQDAKSTARSSQSSDKIRTKKGGSVPRTTGSVARQRRRWSKPYFLSAEQRNDREEFSRICIHHLDQVQRFLLRHPEAFERAFPNFHAYVDYRRSCSPYFSHRWESLWRQRVRWANKPTLRMEKYPVTKVDSKEVDNPTVPSKERHRTLANALHSARTMPSIPLSLSLIHI